MQHLIILLLLTITPGMLSCQKTAKTVFKVADGIYGSWEYETLTVDGKVRSAASLNECGYQDVLAIQKYSAMVKYEFAGTELKGTQLGVSNKKICTNNPIDFSYELGNNTCVTNWIRLTVPANRIVSMTEALVIEYEIKQLNQNTLQFFKIRTIVNYGSSSPDKIVLKRMKK